MKNIIKIETLKESEIEYKTGRREKYWDMIYTYFYIGLMIGAIGIILLFMFVPTNINSIAQQLCSPNQVLSYKWNAINSNFDSLICKGDVPLVKI